MRGAAREGGSYRDKVVFGNRETSVILVLRLRLERLKRLEPLERLELLEQPFFSELEVELMNL